MIPFPASISSSGKPGKPITDPCWKMYGETNPSAGRVMEIESFLLTREEYLEHE